MSRIAAVCPIVPAHRYPQREITSELLATLTLPHSSRALAQRMHTSSGIRYRHTVLPLEDYRNLGDFTEASALFVTHAQELAERAVRGALEQAGIAASEVDYVVFTSVTGISAPSIDGMLISRLGFRPDIKRMPSFGLGCVGGAAGLARVHDYLTGHPDEVALLISVELCSLTLQRGDTTLANLVATGLFGDGAAAAVLVGDNRPEPGARILATRSAYLPDTQDSIGWTVTSHGFEVLLTAGVADIVSGALPELMHGFLAEHDLTVDEVPHWVAHPGGPRVLDAFAESLELSPELFARSWESLAQVGNLSSASVLHILADLLAERRAGRSDAAEPAPGMLFALGPGVSVELVLLEVS